MSKPSLPAPSPQSPDGTLISSPPVEVPTQSSLSPQEQTSPGETKSAAPHSTVVDVGTQLGPYKLVDKLGEGGMGAVFKAQQTRLGRMVALKVLPPHVMSRPDALARFDREMKAVGSLHHPNIVQALDAGEFGGVHYLSMDYVEGQDLQQLVKTKGPLSVVNASKAIRQAAQGLAAAHKLGLVHRDIKPSNLFVTKQTGQIKILDMGLALLSHEEVPAALTSTGQCFGTPDYMAPEQWNDAHSCDARADLYSLGCTLFYLLVGYPPYPTETHRTVANKMKGHLIDPIPDLRAVRSDVPPGLVAIYERLMAKQSEDRFASAAELVEALAPFSTSKGAATTPALPTAPESDPALTASEDGPPVGTVPEVDAPALPLDLTSIWTPESAAVPAVQSDHAPPSGSGRRRLLAWGGAAAIVLLGVIIITITSKDGTRTRVEVPGDAQQIEVSQDGKTLVKVTPAVTATTTGWHGWPADAPKPAIAPFDAEQAQRHQEAWAKYLNVPVEYENSLGMKFRLIPPGEFLMGSTPEEIEEALKDVGENKHWSEYIKSEAPQHKVILTQPIYLGVNEVTQSEYEKLTGTNPSHFSSTGAGRESVAEINTSSHPVENVSWNDAAEFCAKLSQREKFKPFYFRADEGITSINGTGYRLPTEAEWEFACRAGTATKYWMGDKVEDLAQAGWFRGNSGGRTHAAGEFEPNPFGLYDLHGNIWEWAQDGWDATWFGRFRDQPAIDPNAPFSTSSLRVLRGGFGLTTTSICRSSNRIAHVPTARSGGSNGFRVSLPVDAVRQALKVTGPAMPRSEISNLKSEIPNLKSPISENDPPSDFTNRIGMEFVKVPKGTGWLGGGGGKPGEQKVEFTDDFYLGKYEVTQEEWEKVTGLNKSSFSRTRGQKDAVKDVPDADLKRFPAEDVTWDECQAFCERLNKQEAESGWVYRLPAGTEWEYACRGGPRGDPLASGFDFYFEKPSLTLMKDQANFDNLLKRPCRVGSYKPNALGLFDLHGNVAEWVEDEAPPDPNNSQRGLRRVFRGGGWNVDSGHCSAANFSQEASYGFNNFVGLRLARVRVSPSQPLSSGPDAPIDFAAERKAAEWVLKVGGSLSLVDAEGQPLAMQGQQLPQMPFAISSVQLNNKFSDDDLENLAACRGLDSLSLNSQANFNGSGLRHLSSVASLQNLQIVGNVVTDEGLASLPMCSRLHALLISSASQLTDGGLRHVGKLIKLKGLGLASLPRVTNAGLAHLDDLSELTSFACERTEGITDEGIKRLFDRNPKLSLVRIGNLLKDEARTTEPLSLLPKLKIVALSSDQLTDAGIATLNSLSQFEDLQLQGSISDMDAKRATQLKRLKQFIGSDIGVFSLSRVGVQALATIPELETIHIYDNRAPDQFDDACLLDLAAARKLKRITMGRPKALTDAGIEAFRKARPDVRLTIDGQDYEPCSMIDTPADKSKR